MHKETIRGLGGYDIPGCNYLLGQEKLVVIISHGFGSSKDSPTAGVIAAALSQYGIGAYAFDFPAHGDSPVDGGMLRIGNCTGDLAAVEAHVRELRPQAEIAYFASSFGAYINLIYLATGEPAGRRSFLRCAAVNMPAIIRRAAGPEHYAELEARGFVTLREGFARPLKITREFLADLDAHDVFQLYRPGLAELAMVHGTADTAAPPEDARRFAEFAGAALTEIAGADHGFRIPGGMDRVAAAAVGFFTARQ